MLGLVANEEARVLARSAHHAHELGFDGLLRRRVVHARQPTLERDELPVEQTLFVPATPVLGASVLLPALEPGRL
jgi:hypothetical protein